ncbi:MAG: hypothetical protein JWO26_3463 [Rhodospirillales bacterium]|jgi:hypothetical protein|nr:hypothetical protein [Rhodospirillales bacterium]
MMHHAIRVVMMSLGEACGSEVIKPYRKWQAPHQ